jgi:hypothetical protein
MIDLELAVPDSSHEARRGETRLYAKLTAVPVCAEDRPTKRTDEMKIEGACHCGCIAYEAKVDPERSAICNCTDCQTLSGAPWRASVPTRAIDFQLKSGEPKRYVKTADSGIRRVQTFCENCGSPIYSTTFDNPEIYNLRLGAVKQRAELPPKRQIWCESALAWSRDVTGIPGVPRD